MYGARIEAYFEHYNVETRMLVLPTTEENKNMDLVLEIARTIHDLGIDGDSTRHRHRRMMCAWTRPASQASIYRGGMLNSPRRCAPPLIATTTSLLRPLPARAATRSTLSLTCTFTPTWWQANAVCAGADHADGLRGREHRRQVRRELLHGEGRVAQEQARRLPAARPHAA